MTSLVRRLTVAGWLLLGGEIGFILFQLERARPADGTRFATAWEQRVEILSFIMFPSNATALAPAAAVAAATTLLAGRDRGPWLVALLRFVAGLAVLMILIGVASIIEIATRDGDDIDLDAVFLRVGGMSLAAGMAYLCRIADTESDLRGDSVSSE